MGKNLLEFRDHEAANSSFQQAIRLDVESANVMIKQVESSNSHAISEQTKLIEGLRAFFNETVTDMQQLKKETQQAHA